MVLSLFVLRNQIFPMGIVEQLDMTWPISPESQQLPFYLWDFLRSAPQNDTPFAPIYAMIILTNSVELVSKALMIFTIFACSISAFSLVYYLNRNRRDPYRLIICFFAATVAVFNPFIFTRFFHLSMLWGFALAPMTLILFSKGIEQEKNWKRNMLIAALVLAFSSISVHAGVWSIILLASYLLFYISNGIYMRFFKEKHISFTSWKIQAKYFLKYFRSFIALVVKNIWFLRKPGFFLLIYVGLISYWLLPQIFSTKIGHPFFAEAVDIINVLSNRASTLNIVRLMGVQAYTSLDTFGWEPAILLSWVYFLTFLSAFLVFLAFILRPKNKFVIFFSLLIPIGIFLAQGSNGPLGGVYLWLMFESPISSLSWLFRDSTRALSLLFISYTFLSAFAIGEISQRMDNSKLFEKGIKKIRLRINIIGSLNHFGTLIVVVLVLSILLFTTIPVILGRFSIGYNYDPKDMVPVLIPREYYDVNDWFRNNQMGDFRVLWLPYEREQLLYTWNYNESDARAINQFISYISSRPSLFIFQGAGVDTTRFLSYTYYDNLLQNRTDFGKIMSITNSKYIVYHDDYQYYIGITPVSNDEPTRVINALNQSNSDLMPLTSFGNFIHVFENQYQTSPLFIASGKILLTGGIDGYSFLNSFDGYNPQDWGIIYSEQNPKFAEDNIANSDAVMFFDKEFEDLVLSMAEPDSFIPVTDANVEYPTEDPTTGWASYGIAPTEFTNIRYRIGGEVTQKLASELDFGLGSVYTSQNNSCLKTSFSTPTEGNYDLWGRAILNGTISVQVDDNVLNTTKYLNENELGYTWEKLNINLSLTKGVHNLKIMNVSGNNTINTLLVIPSDGYIGDFQSLRQRVVNEINESPKRIWYFYNNITVNNGNGYNKTIFIPKSGNYSLFIQSNTSEPLTLGIDDHRKLVNSTIYLNEGSHTMWLTSNNFRGNIGLLSLEDSSKSLEQNFNISPVAYITQTSSHPDPTSYFLTVNATEPFLLVLSESYDSQWSLKYDNTEVLSTPVYSFLNGYWINKTGSFPISINYKPQTMLVYSIYISIFFLVTSIIYLCYPIMKRILHRLNIRNGHNRYSKKS